MARARTKNARIEQVKTMLLTSRDFVAKAEIARRCGVHRSSITRLLDEFPELGCPVDYDERGWVRIDRARYLMDVRLTLDEALAVFIGSRLLARHSDRPNPHVVSGLAKLGLALRGPARAIGDHIGEIAEHLKRRPTAAAREFVRALEVLTRAWADRTSVYVYTRDAPERARKFDPYFIEPTMFTCYAIGYDHWRQDIRTFKIQWLKSVSASTESFTVRPGFDPYDYLGNAWGINWGKGGLTEVRLLFTGRAAERIQDNVWHESQRLEAQSDGSQVLTVCVGSVLEMKPWIRQWGAHCTVLAPDELRREIAEEMQRAAQMYGTTDDERKE